VVTTLALVPMDVEAPELLHGLLATQTEAELETVQVLLREAQDGFTNRVSLSTFTQTLTITLGQVHSFEASYYLLYQTGQTVQATWVIYDRMRADPVQIVFAGRCSSRPPRTCVSRWLTARRHAIYHVR